MNHLRLTCPVAGALLIGSAALTLAACGIDQQDSRATVLRPAETVVPQGTADPRARSAVDAYTSFVRAANQAQQHPLPEGATFPADADLGRYSFDPARAEYEAVVAELDRGHVAYRGTPAQSHVKVAEINQDATPFPRVVLTDCPSGADGWEIYDTRTDAARPEVTTGATASSGVAVTMIFNQQRWGVYTILADPEVTCAPPG